MDFSDGRDNVVEPLDSLWRGSDEDVSADELQRLLEQDAFLRAFEHGFARIVCNVPRVDS